MLFASWIDKVDRNSRVLFEGVKLLVDGPASGGIFESSILMLEMASIFIVVDPIITVNSGF
jgi:hypothetical protein